ncbi:MAG: hypothetical protein JXA37_00195 [Chloroflexia bacterium]|nr:hypothetical protein [Chloroflexia bacterium]
MRKRIRFFLALVLFSLPLLAGCEIDIRELEPTLAPPPPPGSACAATSIESLQVWADSKIERMEEDLAGGVLYLNTPQVSNCIEDSAYFQLRVGYKRDGFRAEVALLEGSFDLSYDAEGDLVCLDLHALLQAEELDAQGVEQVGQEIKVVEAQAELSSARQIPAEERQQLEQALDQASIQGDPQTQGVGPEGAGILLDWSLDDLLERFNTRLAELAGACIPAD